MKNFDRPLILASGSPRRRQLLETLGLTFDVRPTDIDESIPDGADPNQVPVMLALKKARALELTPSERAAGAIVLAADTVVILEGRLYNKPIDAADALRMLDELCGRTHTVVTGIALRDGEREITLSDECRVTMTPLSPAEKRFYVERYRPYDKAGAYGAQDWIGLVGIERLEGSFYTVMGLPTHQLWSALSTLGRTKAS